MCLCEITAHKEQEIKYVTGTQNKIGRLNLKNKHNLLHVLFFVERKKERKVHNEQKKWCSVLICVSFLVWTQSRRFQILCAK